MRIAIVGGAPSGLEAFDDYWDETWVLGNQLDRYIKYSPNLVFEIHDDLSEHDEKYPDWLIQWGIPLIVSDHFPLKEGHTVFPKKEANKLLGGEYLSSSPAYMMAYALLTENVTEIGIFGVDMSVNDHEYFKQRPAMYAWIGYAKGKGIKITIPESSSLCKDSYDEGRDWGKPSGPFSECAIQEMVGIHEAKKAEYEMLVHTHNGCAQAYKRMAKVARAIESGQTITNLTDSVEVL